ncbi:MAG: ATP-binding protein [Bacteroidales bacterium]
MLVHLGIATVIAALLIAIYFFQYRKLRRTFSRHNLSSVMKEKELLQQLFDNMPDRIYFKDRQSRFILANKYVSAVQGEKDPRKLISKTDFDFYDKELAQAYFDDEQRIMKEGEPMINKEERGLDPYGNEVVVSTTKIPIRDSNNIVIGIIGIGREISFQKEVERELKENTEKLIEANSLLEERQEEIEQISEELKMQAEQLENTNKELEKLSLVASKTSNVVLIMDANGDFEWANEGFRQKYGMDLEAFKAEYGSNLRVTSSYHETDKVLDKITQNREPAVYISEFTDKNGVKTWSQTNLTPILNHDGEITNLVLIDSDITDLKHAEAQIREQNEEITTQSVELHRLIASRNKLLSIIGHDLKNPLNSIIGFADLLQTNLAALNEEQVKKYSEIIYSSSKSAYYLLENLLDWSRLQTGRLQQNPVSINISDLVKDVIPLYKANASDKRIELINKVGHDLHVFADRNMVNTVVRNITGNAIKYTEEGGSVTFSADAKGKDVSIRIEDTGIGMAKDVIEKLFHSEDVQSTPGTAGEKGTGLGLIIAREFLEKNQGKLEVESEPGKGTTFIITLPAEELPSA